jgi:hypothetical protein
LCPLEDVDVRLHGFLDPEGLDSERLPPTVPPRQYHSPVPEPPPRRHFRRCVPLRGSHTTASLALSPVGQHPRPSQGLRAAHSTRHPQPSTMATHMRQVISGQASAPTRDPRATDPRQDRAQRAASAKGIRNQCSSSAASLPTAQFRYPFHRLVSLVWFDWLVCVRGNGGTRQRATTPTRIPGHLAPIGNCQVTAPAPLEHLCMPPPPLWTLAHVQALGA